MARPISDEELQLKKRARRRLVGAIVLVSVVAVVLPMVLDSEPKSVKQNVDIQIPASDSAELKPRAVTPAPTVADNAISKPPITAAQADDPAPKSDTRGTPKAIVPVPASDTSAAAKAMAPASQSAPSADPAPTMPAVKPKEGSKSDIVSAKPSAPDSTKAADKDQPKVAAKESASAYVIQVAALADASRVKQLQKQMAGAGVKTYTEVVSTKSGDVTRVRAGPYPTREAAEKARTQLKKAGLEGKVVAK